MTKPFSPRLTYERRSTILPTHSRFGRSFSRGGSAEGVPLVLLDLTVGLGLRRSVRDEFALVLGVWAKLVLLGKVARFDALFWLWVFLFVTSTNGISSGSMCAFPLAGSEISLSSMGAFCDIGSRSE